MAERIIEVNGLSKRYTIGADGRVTLGRLMRAAVWWPYQKLRGQPIPPLIKRKEAFWSLRNVTFNVERGEVVGIIGSNGAGKSTLLKILSRIIYPTQGEAKIFGRISSLLEVGTGFNANLSGRENIFLNASLHGLSRKEICKKFDEIVEFSGVERFIDMPVKHYSSGMYSRLAFSVSAHLEPDVLFVDEVLSVGDLSFQRKCLNKFSEMVGGARTVLFVSHNLSAISNICSKVLWLDRGEVRFFGSTEEGISAYYQAMLPAQSESLALRFDRIGTGDLRFNTISFYDRDMNPCERISSGQELIVGLGYEAKPKIIGEIREINVATVFKNDKGQRVFGTPSAVLARNIAAVKKRGQILLRINKLPLVPGVYDLDLGCTINRLTVDKIVSAKKIIVTEADYYGTGKLPSQQMGDVLVDYEYLLAPDETALSVPGADEKSRDLPKETEIGKASRVLKNLFSQLLIRHSCEIRYFERILQSMNVKPYFLIHNLVAKCLMLSDEGSKKGLSEIYSTGRLDKDLGGEINQLVSSIGFKTSLQRSNIRELYCAELFEGIDNISLPLKISSEAGHHPNHMDMLFVVAIAAYRSAKRIFEFGTYLGRTTCGLASISESASVYTLNLLPEEDFRYGPYLGQLIKSSPYRERITQIYCDSKKFVTESYKSSMDYIFVDADHSYEGVKNDTEKAFEMLAPGGAIVWHDYAAKSPGVYEYLSELSQKRPLFRIKNTCLVIYLDGVNVAAFIPARMEAHLEDAE